LDSVSDVELYWSDPYYIRSTERWLFSSDTSSPPRTSYITVFSMTKRTELLWNPPWPQSWPTSILNSKL
jgi:hypothetical protein